MVLTFKWCVKKHNWINLQDEPNIQHFDMQRIKCPIILSIRSCSVQPWLARTQFLQLWFSHKFNQALRNYGIKQIIFLTGSFSIVNWHNGIYIHPLTICLVVVEFEVLMYPGKNKYIMISCQFMFLNATSCLFWRLTCCLPLCAKFPLRHLNPPSLPRTTNNSFGYWNWGVLLGRLPLATFLGNINIQRKSSWILNTKDAHIISQFNQHGSGRGGGPNIIIVVIEVDWIFNLWKPILGQNWVGIKLRNQSGLEDLMCNKPHLRHQFHDCSIGFSKHFVTIQHIWINPSCLILNNG